MLSMQDIWNYMWKQLRNSTMKQSPPLQYPPLQSLEVRAGNPRVRAGPWQWDYDYYQVFRARLSERDYEAKAGIVKITNDKVDLLLMEVRQEDDFRLYQRSIEEAYLRADVGPPDTGREFRDLMDGVVYAEGGPQPHYRVKPF
jgi:hypothetical protein